MDNNDRTNMESIPLVDLGAQHLQIEGEVRAGFDRVFKATSFIGGADVGAFENEYAEFCGTSFCVGLANGTDALELAYRALGMGVGHEVVLPANTFIATAEAVSRTGARVVLTDCDPESMLIDPDQVAVVLTTRTRAIVGVDLYGQIAPFDALATAGKGFDLALVEDGAQSQGAKRNGISAGGFGAAAATSFYPGKNLGAYGDGGAVLTNDPEIARRIRSLGAHGSTAKYLHPELGFNSRLDTLQAVVLRAKLTRLANWNSQRRTAAAYYDQALAPLAASGVVRLTQTQPGNEHVFHLYVVRVAERDQVLKELNANGVGAGIHYPIPVHLQGAYADLGYRAGAFPVAEQAASEILSLPLFPGITESQLARVVEVLSLAVAR